MHILDRGEQLPIITTARLVLRDITVQDISPEYVAWLNNPDINRFLEVRLSPQSFETLRDYIEEKQRNSHSCKHFGVYDRGGTRLVGTVTLPSINWYHRFSDISFVIGHPEVQRQGYASEAIRAIITYAFTVCKLEKLVAGLYEDNIASAALLAKFGFQEEGRLRKEVVNYKGERVDKIRMGLLTTEAQQIIRS